MITIKDEREIDLMRHAGHVVGLVHQELAKWLKPGLTTEQVSDFCEKIIRKNGCTPSFLNLYNFPGAVCTSVNDVVVHGIPNGYVLKDGDIISVDVGHAGKDIMGTLRGHLRLAMYLRRHNILWKYVNSRFMLV